MLSRIGKRSTLLFVGICMFVNTALTQPYYFSHYQVEDGLSNNAVMCSLQDQRGFMWFGTRDGLNRFDGLSFKVFRHDPKDSNSIGSNAVNSLCQDENKRIWAGTEKGLFSYDYVTERFSNLKVAGNQSMRDVKAYGSSIWFISLYTLYAYNTASRKLTTFKIDKEITSYCVLKDNTLWIATSAGTVGRYNAASNTFIEYNLFSKSPYAVSKWIESIFDTGTGTLLIGTSNQGLKAFDVNSGSYEDVLTYNPDRTEIIVRNILAINAHEYWIATQSGIYILNVQTNQSIQLTKQQNDPYSLSDNIVHTLCRDREGGIWAGTFFGGLNYFPKQYVTFKKYFPKYGTNSISGNAVRVICNDGDGNIWIGTEDAGLNKFNPATGTFINFNPEFTKQSVSYSNIHGLLVNKDEVWAGTYLHGLDVLHVKTGKRIRSYTTGNSSIGSNFIYSLYKTRSNKIIAATDKGLYNFNSLKNDFEPITVVPNVFYRTVHEDRNGAMWAGTYGDGVFYYNSKTGKQGNYSFDPNYRFSLPGNMVNDIYEDSDGIMWFATEGGLCKYEDKTKRFKRFTKENGFPSDVTYSILEDSRKNLWVSTSKGLVCLFADEKGMKVYTKSHGLLTDQFNYSSGYKGNDGQMYFGSVRGLISFHPDSILTATFSPPVFITGFQVYNKELSIDQEGSPLKQSIITTTDLVLPYNQSSFSIDFAALSFTAPNMIRYAYIMEGLDENWTYLETNRKVYFTELTPGTYTFKVKTSTDATNDLAVPAILTIKILPPWWRTWWAYSIYAIAVIGVIYFTLRHFINRAKEKTKRRLEKLEFDKEREHYNDKIEFFTNVAHEIRTPLTLIQGPMENIMERAEEVPLIKNSLQIMNRNTERLLQLSNQLLDFRKVEMNGFRLNFLKVDITRLLMDQYMRFEMIAEQKKIAVAIDLPDSFYAAIDVEAFNKIISNLLDNAIKYAKSNVQIALLPGINNPETFSLSFKNDGYIIPPEIGEKIFISFYRAAETGKLPGTGIGLTLSRSLAEMHRGSLTLEFSDKEMNEFILTLPIEHK